MAMYAVEVDPMTFAGAVVMILGGFGAMVVQIIQAWFNAKRNAEAHKDRMDLMVKADDAASAAKVAASSTQEAHSKLDMIKRTSEEAAKNVNGNLSAVREELSKALAANESLRETIATLTEIVKTQRAQSRATDPKPGMPPPPSVPTVPVEVRVVNETKTPSKGDR